MKMKNLINTLILALTVGVAFSQAPPQGINYQAVAIDKEGAEIAGTDVVNQPVREQEISVRFTIIEDTPDGNETYQETHLTTTDEDGLFNLVIGIGDKESGFNDFADIDWGTGLHFLKVELDLNAGSDFSEVGTSQFWSVPYALYSELAGNGIETILDNGDGTTTIVLTNGDEYEIESLEGPEGPQGEAGPEGPAGPQGNPGPGITDIEDNGDGTLTITYGNGDVVQTSDLTGPQGPAGAQGAQGPAGPQGDGITDIEDNGDGTLTITYGSGATVTTSDLTGPQGPTGATGATGAQGPQGDGIVDIEDNGDGTLDITYGNSGDVITTGDLTGPQGPTGAQGAQGPQGIQGPQGDPGISVNWLGTFGSAPATPDLNDAYYNSTDGVSYIWDGSTWQIVAQDGTGGGSGDGNTLDEAYNEGGPGAGRVINANDGSVEINAGNGTSPGVLVNTAENSAVGLDVQHTGTGVGIRAQSTNAANDFSTIQAETNSSDALTSAILGSNSGAGYAVSGQIPASATGTAAVYGNNLRTNGGSGVSGIGLNGTVGEATNNSGFGIYGNNPNPPSDPANPDPNELGIGTYGIGFHGIYGQTTDVTNGWAGYFTADVGIDQLLITGGDIIGLNNGLIMNDLDVLGDVFANDFIMTSDDRLKSNKQKLTSPLEKINQLNGYYYDKKIKSKNNDSHAKNDNLKSIKEQSYEYGTKKEFGLIAQEVEELFPDLVTETAIFKDMGDDTKYKSVKYMQFIPIMVESIKELNNKVEELEKENEELKEMKSELELMKQEIEKLKNK